MNQLRAMSVRGRALPLLIGALALALAIGGRASADTCLLSSSGWVLNTGEGPGSVDAAGTVTLQSALALQGPIAAQHPVLSGTVKVVVGSGTVYVALLLKDSGGNLVAAAYLESPQVFTDTYPTAFEMRSWHTGTPTNFTLDAKAMLALHFPGIDLSTVANVTIVLFSFAQAEFSNLCLTDASPPYAVTSLSDPNKAVKSGAVIPLKLQLRDAGGTNVSSSSLVVNATGLVQKDGQPDGVLTDPGNANADNNFRYDATLQGYIYNLKTTGLASGTWCLTFTVNGQSDSSYQLIFNVK
jgi:hypothetical protein